MNNLQQTAIALLTLFGTIGIHAEVPKVEYLFSIPNTEEQFGTVDGGMVVTSKGVFLHNWHALYFAPQLPTSFEELNRLPLPEDFRRISSYVSVGDVVYYRLSPLLNPDNTGIGLGYIFSIPDGSPNLVDVSEDFHFAPEPGGSADRLAIPNRIRPYGDRWIAYFPGPYFSFYRFDPRDNSYELIEGAWEIAGGSSISHWDFALIDNVVVTGGETDILDWIYIFRGMFSADAQRLFEPENPPPPYFGEEEIPMERIGDEAFYSHITGIQNRNILVWHSEPRTGTFFGAGEAVIIRSTDLARSFQFVQKYDQTGCCSVNVPPDDISDFSTRNPYYPYLSFIETSGKYARHVLVAGSDKATNALYLGFSPDNGDSWLNYRELIGEYGEIPVFLYQIADGVFYLGITRRGDETLNILRLTLPDPVAAAFPQATYEDGGWWLDPRFGWFEASHYPWVWSYNQNEWLWMKHAGNAGGWILDGDLGWTWLNVPYFPWVYSRSTASWLYYRQDSNNPRWFYDLEVGKWVSVP